MGTDRPRFTWDFASRRRIGQLLVDSGFLDQDQLWEILEEARKTGGLTGETAVRLGYVTPEQLREALAEQQRPEQ